MEEDFREFQKKYGEDQMRLFRQQVLDNFKKLQDKRGNLGKATDAFRLQLITVSGGTITIFVSLRGTQLISDFTIVGFVFLGLSLIFGVLTLFLGLESKELEIMMEEESTIQSEKMSLDFIKKFGAQDVGFDEMIMSEKEKLVADFKSELGQRQTIVNEVLKLIHLDAQKIADWQILFFMVGVLALILGILI